MWKILISQIEEWVYNTVESRLLFSEKQKSRLQWNYILRYMNQHVLKKAKMRRKKCRHSRGIESELYDHSTMDFKTFKNVQNLRTNINFITKAMKNWKAELIRGQSREEMKIEKSISPGNSLSLLLFAVVMIPLNYYRRKCKGGYSFTK